MSQCVAPASRLEGILYSSEVLPTPVLEAAMSLASQVGYSQFEEELLECRILDIRALDTSVVPSIFPDYSDTDIQLLRVVWQTWAIPNDGFGTLDKAIEERIESVIVDRSSLLSGDVYSYGLAPEYHWAHWEDYQPSGCEYPEEVYEALCNLIQWQWQHEVLEYAEDPDFINNLSPKLQDAILKIKEELGDQDE